MDQENSGNLLHFALRTLLAHKTYASLSHWVWLSANRSMVALVGSLSLFTNYLRQIHAVMGMLLGESKPPGSSDRSSSDIRVLANTPTEYGKHT